MLYIDGMHTFVSPAGARFHYSSDLSGSVVVDVHVTFADLEAFVDAMRERQKVAREEDDE